MGKKRMISFELDFISAVDRPAQEPATVTILKRADDVEKMHPKKGESKGDFTDRFHGSTKMQAAHPDKKKRTAAAHAAFKGGAPKHVAKADEDKVAFIKRLLDEGKIDEATKAAKVEKYVILTTPTNGHSHLIYTGRFDGGEDRAGSSSWAEEHTHPWMKDEFDNVKIGFADGHVHEIAILTKQDKEPTAEEAAKMSDKKTPEELAAETAKRIKTLEADLAKSRAVNALNDEHKVHLATIKGADADAFVAKSSDERDAVINAAKVADDVVFKAADGTLYRKSDDARLVNMAKQADADRATIAKERGARRDAEYAKRADAELANMTGDAVVKVALLKAVDEITDEELRGKVVETLKAADGKLVAAFETRGTMGKTEGSGNPHGEIEKMARDHAAKHNVSFEKAYTAVLDTPQGAALYTKHVEMNPTQ